MGQHQFYEFFAGSGLARLGLGSAWTCLWANDVDVRKARIYAANFGADELLVGDVNEVGVEQLPPGADLAWASFPCQDLSLAGWRRGMSAHRSGTFWAFWRLIRDLHQRDRRPPLIVLENVPGLLYGDDFASLCEALAALRLQVGALVIDARRFLPQSRPRIFVVAVDAGVDCDGLIEERPEASPWFPKPLWSARDALPTSLAVHWRWWRLPVPEERPPALAALLEAEPADGAWHAREETGRLLGMMSERNLTKVREATERGGRSVGLLYRRTRAGRQRAEVRFDGVAGCLRTPEGGSSRQIVLVVEGDRVRSRLLMPREAARLMGAPDSFQLPGSYTDAYRAMGDAVAVPVIAWLSEQLLTPLAERARAEQRSGAILASAPEANGRRRTAVAATAR
jgi:DNA (cytosine-5)-methyltransferase 1